MYATALRATASQVDSRGSRLDSRCLRLDDTTWRVQSLVQPPRIVSTDTASQGMEPVQ